MFFEKVSDMLFRIGKSTDIHQDFTALFPQSEKLQDLAYDYLTVVVNISTRIVHYAQKSTLAQVASSLQSSFESTFTPLELQLKDIGEQIHMRTNSLAMEKNEKNHALTHRFVSAVQKVTTAAAIEARARALEAGKHRVLSALCTNQGEFDMIWRQHRSKGHSSWLFREPAYQNWAAADRSSLLWLHGRLGSGKSVVMASAVADLDRNRGKQKSSKSYDPSMVPLNNSFSKKSPKAGRTPQSNTPITVSHFFCTSASSTTLKASTIIASITYQILASNSLSPHFTKNLQQDDGTIDLRVEPRACIDLLISITPEDWKGYIVLDGIDDCLRDDVDVVFEELKRLSTFRTILLLSSSRPLWKHLKRATCIIDVNSTITLEEADRDQEITSFISANIEKWKKFHTLPTDFEDIIREQLQLGWDGMFLWLALQMEGISHDLDSGIPIGDIISNLPRNLPETYDRALLRIKDQPLASKILKLVVAAEPALKLNELRVAACIIPGDLTWSVLDLPVRGSVFLWQYGGHLLELDEDENVRFIHYSAAIHLMDPAVDPQVQALHFDLTDAKQHLALVCVTYLNLSVFDQTVSTRRQQSYGLHQVDVPGIVTRSAVRDSRLRTALKYMSPSKHQNINPVDIEHLISQYKAQQIVTLVNVQDLLDYAKRNWLSATRELDITESKITSCWKKILDGRVKFVSLPFDSSDPSQAVTWVILNGHHCLFRFYLPSWCQEDNGANIVFHTTSELLRNRLNEFQIIGPTLFLLVVQLLESATRLSFPVGMLARLIWCPGMLQTSQPQHELSTAMVVELRRLAPIIIQLLLLYADMEDMVHEFLSYVTPFADMNAPLYRGKNAKQLARNLNRPLRRRNITLEQLFTIKATNFPPLIYSGGLTKVGGSPCHSTPFLKALEAGHTDCVKVLLDYGVNCHRKDQVQIPPLEIAVRSGSSECVRMLLDCGGVDIEGVGLQDFTALMHASMDGELACVKTLLESGADADRINSSSGSTALFLAVGRGQTASVKMLLDHGADAEMADKYHGTTPLIYALTENKINCVNLLLRYNVNVDSVDRDGNSVLMHAMKENNQKLVSSLLEKGANFHARNHSRQTALHKGAENKASEALGIFLHRVKGIDVNVQDDTGSTPLHYACEKLHLPCVRQLVAAGARLDLQNRSGQTAEDVVDSNWVQTPDNVSAAIFNMVKDRNRINSRWSQESFA